MFSYSTPLVNLCQWVLEGFHQVALISFKFYCSGANMSQSSDTLVNLLPYYDRICLHMVLLLLISVQPNCDYSPGDKVITQRYRNEEKNYKAWVEVFVFVRGAW